MFIAPGKDSMMIIDDVFYEVETRRLSNNTKIKKGNSNKAFPIGNYVYPYRGKFKSNENKVGLYKTEDGYVIIEPESDSEKEKYSIRRVFTLDTASIFDHVESNTDQFIQLEDIEVINNNTDIYVPIIKDEDDFLKYIVKKAIIDKQINLKNYKDKFKNEYSLNNMKSSLGKSTKMTIPNFKAWCEVLGIKWEMTVRDDGTDTIRPLNETIHITSDEF